MMTASAVLNEQTYGDLSEIMSGYPTSQTRATVRSLSYLWNNFFWNQDYQIHFLTWYMYVGRNEETISLHHHWNVGLIAIAITISEADEAFVP